MLPGVFFFSDLWPLYPVIISMSFPFFHSGLLVKVSCFFTPILVYHAIYLEELTAVELTEKLAQLFSISPRQISQIFKQGPTGIHVLVSDEVRASTGFLFLQYLGQSFSNGVREALGICKGTDGGMWVDEKPMIDWNVKLR